MPVGSVKFIKEGAYPRKAALIIALSGAVGVYIAAKFVSNLPMDVLTWLVIAVIFYTSASMLIAANKASKSVETK